MEKLPKDLIMQIALEYDLPEILAFCRTNKLYNQIICENNTFWNNKLIRDFGLTFLNDPNLQSFKSERLKQKYIKESLPAKIYYIKIKNELRDTPDAVLVRAIFEDRLDLVKAAIRAGANIVRTSSFYVPLVLALEYNRENIYEYIMKQDPISSKDTSVIITQALLNLIETNIPKSRKVELSRKLFNEVIPKTIPYLKPFVFFWKNVVNKLIEINADESTDYSDFYEYRLQQFRELANQ